jgi:hypothetical protein
MISLPSNFPRRIRIRGGEFGASARAMHRKAALENVSRATIERKTMSTKTTFKRVALVAVAALGIGMLSAVPSNAAPSAAYGTMFSGTAGNQIIGGQANVLITLDTSTTAISNTITSSGVGSIVSATVTTPGTTAAATVSAVTGGTSFTAVGASGAADGVVTAILTSTVVGTQTLTITPVASNGTPGTAVTKTITWLSGAANSVVNHSTAFIGAVSGTEVAADVALTPSATASATAVGQIDVRQYASSDSSVATATASTAAVTVSIAGAGSVSTAASAGATGPSVTIAAGGGVANRFTLYVYANGVAGIGTITIAVGGVTVATKTVTLAGTLASYKLTPTNTVTAIGGTADVVTVGPLDTNGNTAALGTYYVTSSNTAVATVPSAGQTGTTFSVTGVAVGTATITVANAATAPTITKTYTVTVGKATAKTVTLSTDKTSYAAGEKIILTVTAVGSDGTATGDNAAFVAFSSAGMTSNVALQGFPTVSSNVKLVGGVATYTIYAPMTDGTVTIQATEGTGIDHVAADSTTAAVLSTSFDVSNAGSSAAVDAANAATDAANYAADAADAATTAAQEATAAAQAAQDSADAATAAVVALGLRVNVLMASVRAQLTSLSNLLVRIIKKTHA